MSIFSHVQAKKPRYNTFDLSHDRKMSMNMGELVPIFCAEAVPGDRFSMSTSQMLRFAPMLAPVMHRVTVYTHFFFVPNRIVWPNWEDFITGGEDGTAAPVFPYGERTNGFIKGTIADYLGIPTDVSLTVSNGTAISALPFAAYNKIYNEYYRDQNLIEPVQDTCIDGLNALNSSGLRGASLPYKRAWQHDYFTSALPWTQKGPQATIPVAGEIDFGFQNSGLTEGTSRWRTGNGDYYEPASGDELGVDQFANTVSGVNNTTRLYLDNSANLTGELSSASATTINDLRQAFRLQEWLERNARGGSRYKETILSHFGVHTSDGRLQRPEFLGGGSTPVTISEVLQTSDASAQETPQGNMAGHGISVGKNHSFSKRVEEHGFFIGIMSVMPKTAYQQGIPKQFLKFDKFDYYWPSFANLGEQPIYSKELYVTEDIDENEAPFGYTPRYAEYKFMSDTVHGEFRDSLDFWHMGRKFDNRPALNEDFINSNPTDRIFAVLDSEKLYVHVYHKIKAKRPMPYFGSPTI